MRSLGMLGASIAAAAVMAASRETSLMSDAYLPPFGFSGEPNWIPFGSSKWSVAKDKRRAKKRAAIKRARRMGHA